MRLRKVVLAGFKSFVDPTTIEFPSDLVGIVGPNGCGKSNVIDAVRWVMGEISARHLRGGSMADVIFNGSTARKPVGQASVELVFDNSDGRLGERYAAYTDISVRRQVAREGASSYFLNGSRCRRRDVTDLFLGTGLGPRSYAVIEQGMISRIVEARPEELRDYLEEVAGISRYKERRRETENRIRHTREHLERLTDVREELGKQLARLERQAKQAERYKVLKAEEDQLEVQLLALQWGRLDDEAQRRAQSVEGNSTAVEGVTAQLRHLEALIEQVRAEQGTAAEAANDAYRAVLDASAEVARTEETIDGLGRQRQAVEDGMRREQSAFEEAKAHLSGSEAQLAELRENLRTGEPHFARLEEEMASARDRFGDSERRMHEWQAGWEDLARRVREPAEVAHAERARIESLEERIQRITDRRRKLDADASEIDVGAAEQALAQATEAELATEVAQEAADTGLESAADGMRETRAQGEASSRDLHDARAALMQLQSTHASLTALQRDAMDGADVAVTRWLADTGLAEAGRLVESIRVDDGWSRAVETILDTLLEAIAVENLDGAAEHFGSLQGGPLAIVATHVEGPAEAGDSRDDGLANRVHSPAVVRQLLVGARTVESLDSALRQRQSLAHGEFFVTPEGVTVSRNLLRQPRPGQAEDGVIARAQRIRLLAEELAVSEARLSSAEEAQGAAEARRRDAEAALAQAQAAANEAHRQHSIAVAQKNTSARAVDAVNERSGRLIAEREENAARRVVALEELKAGRSKLTAAAEALGAVEAERNAWSASRDELRNALERSRDEWQRLRDEGYQLGLKVEGWRTRVAGLEESNVRYARELTRLETHCVELRSQFEALAEPLDRAKAELQERVAQHTHAENALRERRTISDGLEQKLRELDSSRTSSGGKVEEARSALEAARLEAREALVRRDTVREQLANRQAEPDAVLEALEEGADEAQWTERLAETARRISRLGAINLAAIEEHVELSERKSYLGAQHADLDEALQTLEGAIARIDGETRTRFKETFEKVNEGLGTRFPKLFGGGQAYLRLTDDDLLSAGVSVMAQPPGKRNSTIQLLSGGEKALTAVALVFALFDLNPAPFCLLDEVDAPLDDTNVGRFSELVRDMSEQVQMLVVTHNKVTMEIAQQLVGVTMNEPGVSRLVAVDMNEAVAMVDQS